MNSYNNQLNELFNRTKGIVSKTGYIGYENSITFYVTLDAKLYHKHKKTKYLGRYLMDFSNYLYRCLGLTAKNTNYDDSKRSTKGIKTIKVTLYDIPEKQINQFERSILTGPIKETNEANLKLVI